MQFSQPYAMGGYVIVWYFCIHVFVSTSTLCSCVPHILCVCTHKFILGVQFCSVRLVGVRLRTSLTELDPCTFMSTVSYSLIPTI